MFLCSVGNYIDTFGYGAGTGIVVTLGLLYLLKRRKAKKIAKATA